MSSDLPDGLLGSASGDREGDGSSDAEDEERTYRRFLFLEIGRHRLAIPVEDVRAISDQDVEKTRIPRTPAAIEGMTDIRGQITVLIDPHVHFPDSGGPSANPSLLVFDRSDQPAAITVDEIHGVESVPEDDVIDAGEFDPEEIDGTPLAHPLVVGVIRRERRTRDPVMEVLAAERTEESESGPGDDLGAGLLGRDRAGDVDEEFGVEVDEFSLEEDEPEMEHEPEPDQVEVELEVTPLLDVDRLLLASGRVADSDLESVAPSQRE